MTFNELFDGQKDAQLLTEEVIRKLDTVSNVWTFGPPVLGDRAHYYIIAEQKPLEDVFNLTTTDSVDITSLLVSRIKMCDDTNNDDVMEQLAEDIKNKDVVLKTKKLNDKKVTVVRPKIPQGVFFISESNLPKLETAVVKQKVKYRILDTGSVIFYDLMPNEDYEIQTITSKPMKRLQNSDGSF